MKELGNEGGGAPTVKVAVPVARLPVAGSVAVTVRVTTSPTVIAVPRTTVANQAKVGSAVDGNVPLRCQTMTTQELCCQGTNRQVEGWQ